MTERDALVRAICEEPDEDTPRLAYADWLDERGDHDRAEFIRVQCELARSPAGADVHRLEFRANELLGRHEERWAGDLKDLVLWYRFGRVFVEDVGLDADVFLARSDDLLRLAPLRKAFIRTNPAQLPGVTASPDLPRLRTLRLGFGIGDGGAEVISRSPLLADLRELDLTNNALGPAGIEALTRSPYLTGVTALGLGDNQFGNAGVVVLGPEGCFPNLGVLDLSRNGLDIEGVLALVRNPLVTGLHTLSLRANPVGPNGTWALTETPLLTEHGVLSKLDLSECQLGDAGVVDLAWARWGERLRKLYLGYNDIGHEGAEALAESPYLSGLTELNLVGNPLSDESRVALRGKYGLKVML